jgi:myo-inositol-1(or 4)-monophosphatase
MDDDAALRLLRDVTAEAGALALRLFRAPGVVDFKPDGSPVTEGDRLVDALIVARLAAATPELPILAEESTADTLEAASDLWVVDAIDGTRSFIEGGDEWSISAAMVRAGRPVAGVLCRPTTGDLYCARRGGGATRNGASIAVTAGARVEALRYTSAKMPEAYTAYKNALPGGVKLRNSRSLALRLAQLAEGESDVSLVREGAGDWDLGAADIILSEAGGVLSDTQGRIPRYGAPPFRQPFLVAAGRGRHAELLTALAGLRSGAESAGQS